MRSTVVRGARTHNLKGVDLELRPGELVAFTGPSGAGKSSLAIDTLYAEGQRRFVESFSPYARQFLERLDRPPADSIEPVAAGVAVDRRAPIKSSRSTVATMAELEPYLAALFAREAVPVCPDCGVEAVTDDPTRSARRALDAILGDDTVGRADAGGRARAIVTYPTRVDGPEAYLALRQTLVRDGIRRLRVGGAVRDVDDVRPSEAASATVEVIVDRIVLDRKAEPRLREAVERAWAAGGGRARVVVPAAPGAHENASVRGVNVAEGRAESAGPNGGGGGDRVLALTRGLACPSCARTFDPPRPGLFSYNTASGACPTCRGFGRTIGIDWAKVVPDEGKTIGQGAIRAWAGKSAQSERGELRKLCKKHGIPTNVPYRDLSAEHRALILDGEPGGWTESKFPGIRAWFKWLETRTYKMHVRVFLARYRAYELCTACNGGRLNADAQRYRVGGVDLPGWHRLSVHEASTRIGALRCRDAGGARARELLHTRLAYLEAVGLGHLALERQARTLSGGEAQRVGLTAALGTSLVGALFVVDEPTVGLHASDTPPLVDALRALARAGNAVVLIEHDPSLIAACDRVVELGPGAGPNGGEVLFDGTPSALAKRLDLPSGPTLAGDRSRAPASRRRPSLGRPAIVIRRARAHNLRGVDVSIPLGTLCAITGPSGSGKSTLVGEILAPAAARATGDFSFDPPLEHDGIDGLEAIRQIIHVDQSPLGRTSRGNAATYTKAWDSVRELFSKEGERADGAEPPPPSHFSFNTDGGRCDVCSGEGYETVEMQFLADVAVRCPVCRGRRFKDEVLAVKLRGKDVASLLETTVAEVAAWAAGSIGALVTDVPRSSSAWAKITACLAPLVQVGLGYLPLGQPLSTLSGGEAQRLKLARALAQVAPPTAGASVGDVGKKSADGVLIIVDEPSAGLHSTDVARVVDALQTLVDRGATVVVVEHDLDIVAASDHVVDLGPGGGSDGGEVVAAGDVDAIAASSTRTGVALRAHLRRGDAIVPGGVEVTDAPSGHATNGHSQAADHGVIGGAVADAIEIRHAREHNLKDVSLAVPRNRLVVVTGPSGSGKSTLAFDVIFAEGQRRFLETLSPYARQFLPTLPRPDVESVVGVPPSIALEQRTTRGGRTSTVATVTEVAHYLRLLYAKVGTPHCPKCDAPIVASDPATITARIGSIARAVPRGAGPVAVYAPAIRARKGTHLDVFTRAGRAGYLEARVDGVLIPIDPPPALARAREHTIELVLARGDAATLAALPLDRVVDALGRGGGQIVVSAPGKRGSSGGAVETTLSTKRACPQCGTGVPELDPRWFSFNTAQGRCPACEGTGLHDPSATGDEDEGISRTDLEPCRACGGARLGPLPRGVRLPAGGERYSELTSRAVDDVLRRVPAIGEALFADDVLRPLAEAPVSELRRRLEFLSRVGLGYLSLDRPAYTLSGGEMQRLRLAAQLGSGLTGALYVLDEPTIGLHPRDTHRLISNLRALVDTGSTVIVVEHDADTIRAADYLIDLGPAGGREGGNVIAEGAPSVVLEHATSPTAVALRAPLSQAPKRMTNGAPWIELRAAAGHNLQDVDFKIPVGRLTVVAGVSGSGKSTLVRQVFYPAIRRALKLQAPRPLPFGGLTGAKHVARAVAVDQSPIGRTSRSVPATFLGIFDPIRRLFASTPDAQIRGFSATRFSFNSATGGRCEACSGGGAIVSEMSFLPDVFAPCEACGGMRYEPATLACTYLGRSIGDVLHMTAHDAAELFAAHPNIAKPLRVLDDLGVGYVTLGQGSNTLSGGEAQRLKLASELSETARRLPTLYVLDEPTTGLHVADVRKLLDVCMRLVARGDTLVVIEHHPEVIAVADHVIELGPEGGAAGGRLVAQGTPREVAKAKTATGDVLRVLFATERRREATPLRLVSDGVLE